LVQGNMSPVLPSELGVTYHVVLASSMKLEYPLYDALPNTTNSRDRLLAKIFQYRRNAASAEEGTPVAKDEDYEMLYAYTLVTGQIAEEIKRVEKEVEDLFGILDEEVLTLQ
jgi:undecaprenyl pyrophosphate synthase